MGWTVHGLNSWFGISDIDILARPLFSGFKAKYLFNKCMSNKLASLISILDNTVKPVYTEP